MQELLFLLPKCTDKGNMATNENVIKAIRKLYKEKHDTDFIGVIENGKVIDQGSSTKSTFIAVGGETSVDVSYTPGLLDVYLNNVKLVDTIDYTAITGSNISGLAALTASDVVTLVSFRELPSQEEIDAESEVQQAAEEAEAYRLERKWDYPEIGDQLDDLYKKGEFSDEMAAKLEATKSKYPKP